MAKSATILFITQVYVPDPASGGQYVAEVAASLAARGHRVVVMTSDRGYEDPERRYPKSEIADGVEVRRFGGSSFGKRSLALRLLAGLLFLIQATMHALLMPGLDRVVILSVPIMSAAAGAVISLRRRVRVIFWILDLNPDQLVALGLLGARSWPVRLLDFCNRILLRRAAAVVVLDRHMAARVRAKFDPGPRMHIIPPWPQDLYLETIPHDRNPFREEQGMNGKRVIMYSGNHAMSNPIATVLDAATRFRDDDRLRFTFIGGGVRKREVEAQAGPNVQSLPYQPLERIKYSLSAGDVHVATIGNGFVGIVHPCKVYGSLILGRPILSVGPSQSHIADLAARGAGWHIEHGDVDGAERVLQKIAGADEAELRAIGERAQQIMRDEFDAPRLRGALADVIDGTAAAA